MESIKNYVRDNKLNVATYIIAFLQIIMYIMGLLYFKAKPIDELLSMSAHYVAICSCIIVLIQLVAFFSDSRHKESRCRKEAALKLADEYATEILNNIIFIQNVLSKYYDKNAELLNEKISNLNIDKFTYKDMDKSKGLEKYLLAFENGKYEIPYEIIMETAKSHSISYDDVINSKKMVYRKDKEYDLNKIANTRFRHTISYTLNKLECFSMSVTHNVAESEMLFPSIHQTYLKFVRYMYPYICTENKDEENYYSNIIDLYRTWESVQKAIEQCREEGRKHADKMIKDKKRKFKKPL